MTRREKLLALVALLGGAAAFLGQGWCVFLYPGLLAWLTAGATPRRRLLLCGLWGVAFSALFYHWVGAYGVLPWLALSLVRGLPWLLFPVPSLLLSRWREPSVSGAARCRLEVSDLLGAGLGLGLVAWALLLGITGVDWETPAGALTAWPAMLAPLRWVGLAGVACAIGWVSALLLSGSLRLSLLGGALLLGWWLGAPSLVSPAAPWSGGAVALLQPGYSQSEKWDEGHREASMDWLLSRSEEAAREGAELVIWPETAWPYRGMRRRVTNTRRIGKAARRAEVDLLASSIEERPERADWSNSVSLVQASGRFTQHYEKRRLAPFAEYIPLPESVAKLLRSVAPFSRISRFVPGEEPVVFQTSKGRRFAVLICYESMTPGMAAALAPEVDFLVVVTNDAPFASAQANEAHFRSAVLRAIETGKPVLQAANTGVTGAVNGNGAVIVRTAPGFSGPTVQYLRS